MNTNAAYRAFDASDTGRLLRRGMCSCLMPLGPMWPRAFVNGFAMC